MCVCVCQVFVANPNKPKAILDILLRNKDKLVDFLTKFHTDRSEDEQFNDEKAYLIKQVGQVLELLKGPCRVLLSISLWRQLSKKKWLLKGARCKIIWRKSVGTRSFILLEQNSKTTSQISCLIMYLNYKYGRKIVIKQTMQSH